MYYYDDGDWGLILAGYGACVAVPMVLAVIVRLATGEEPKFYIRFVGPWIAGLAAIFGLRQIDASAWWGVFAAGTAVTLSTLVAVAPARLRKLADGVFSRSRGEGLLRRWGQLLLLALGSVALAVAFFSQDDGRMVMAFVGATLLFAGLALRAMSLLSRAQQGEPKDGG